MRVCVIDGRGGGLGSRLVAGLHSELGSSHNIVALGTNTVAAAAMKQAGAVQVGVGPRAIAGTLPSVDVIVASLNLVVPGAMLGEVTPEIVQAILGARATKVLLPLNRARLEIVGAGACTLEALITESLSRVRSLVNSAQPA
ncbi:MAG TPA: DUF3842 family protein [Nitrospiraceae bacterium]|nr:DUF3842 family protein [Nitrospiraceae bacterium]